MCKRCAFRIVVRGLVLMFGLVLSAPAGAEVLFFDDFAYPNGTNLNGIGGWTAADATAHRALNDDGLGDGGTNSLQYPGVPSLDGRLYVTAGSGNVYHALSRPVTGEGNCLYASFLYKPLSIPGTYWFQLDTTGSIQGQLGRIDGKSTDGQVELGCRMRTATVLSKKPIPLGQTAFVVMKVTMVPGSNNDTVQLWVNPPVGAPEPPADATAISETGNDINPATGIIGFSFRVGQSNSGEKEVDLMRLGTIWEDVTAHPYVAASGPAPRDGAEDVPRDAVLSWFAGQSATTHDVYFGAVLADVNTADRTSPKDVLVGQGQDVATYAPGLLAFGQTYYWRVDEVNAPSGSVTKGSVWSFTVEPYAYPIANVIATASSSRPDMGPEKTTDGSGLDGSDRHGTEATTMWQSAGATPNWIRYEFDQVRKLDELWVWNSNQQMEDIVGFGAKDVAIEYSVDGNTWTPLSGVPVFARAGGSANYAHDTVVDFGGVPAQYVRLTIDSTWGGVAQASLSEVRFFHVPVRAREPRPALDATGQGLDVALSWRAGREAASHRVYLSADPNAVANGTAPANTVSTHHLDLTALDLATTYYWRVDEVNDAENPAVWEGDVWNFSTVATLAVDDMESYDDAEGTGTRIYETWVDGWDVPANGSQVGHQDAPFAERMIVHGGKQSLPFYYDNSTAAYSEAARTFENPQDWTLHGAKGLVLWFYGDPANTAGQMYVKVNGKKVAYDGDPDNLRRKPWQMWYVDLAAFSGVNLKKVADLTIGIEGGSGVVYIDDIGLSPKDRQLVTPAPPAATDLVAHYPFEGNANDAAGKRNGVVGGAPTYVPGQVGQAIKLNGARDYVLVEGSFDLSVYTAAVWFRVEGGTGNRDVLSIFNDAAEHGVLLEVNATGGLRFLHRAPAGSTGGDVNIRNEARFDDAAWYHVAIVKSAESATLYVNGVPAGSAASTTPFDQALTRFALGMLKYPIPASDMRYFPGTMDEVYLYRRVLSEAEIGWLAGRTKSFDKP